MRLAPVRIDPNYYREKARQTLELSKRAQDHETKSYLREVAKEYERLADEAEN